MPPEISIDALDRRLIHALLYDGRAPFRRIAEALGTSEQTIARRHRRMRDAGVLRVVVVPDPRRYPENLFLRIRIQPGAAVAIARAVAAIPEISWVTVSAGGSEVTCSLRSASPGDRDALLLQRLPRASQVTGVTAATLLHIFAEGPETEWHGLPDPLTPAETQALGDGGSYRRGEPGYPPAVPIEARDQPLLAELARDGRASYATLAAATGRSEGQVARRVESLRDSGVIFVDVELAPTLLGVRAWAMLWISVAPAALDRVGREIAGHPESAFVAATTGTSNLVVWVLCHDTSDLYRYLTQRVGAIDGVQDIEVVPAMRVVKQQGSIMDGDRLPDPLAARPA